MGAVAAPGAAQAPWPLACATSHCDHPELHRCRTAAAEAGGCSREAAGSCVGAASRCVRDEKGKPRDVREVFEFKAGVQWSAEMSEEQRLLVERVVNEFVKTHLLFGLPLKAAGEDARLLLSPDLKDLEVRFESEGVRPWRLPLRYVSSTSFGTRPSELSVHLSDLGQSLVGIQRPLIQLELAPHLEPLRLPLALTLKILRAQTAT